MSEALPLPPRPNPEQYKKLAKELQHACRSGRDEAVGEWAVRWVKNLARLQGLETGPEIGRQIEREANWIGRRWQEFKKKNENAGRRCRLADAQMFVARGHGFASWPKFAKHLEELARCGFCVIILFETSFGGFQIYQQRSRLHSGLKT